MSNLTTQNYDGQLIQIVEQSNIEPTKGAQMMQLFVPYFKRMDEVERKISILPAENPSKEDCEMAKAIRKALRDNRLEAERIKKQGKEAIIIEGRLFDNLYNIIDNSSKPLEKRCEAIEKWHEIEEAKRVEAVYLERKNLCDELGADTVFVNIRQMSDDQFTAYIDQIKAAQAAKAEADRIEADRIAAEERKLDDRMKSRLKTLAAMDIDGGLMNIREMPDEQFDTFVKSEQAKIAARAAAAKAAEEARIEAAKIADEQRIAREAAEKEAEKARAEAAEAKQAAEKLAEDARAATAAAAEAAEEARIEAAKIADEQRIAREAAEKEAEKARAEAAEAKQAAEKLAEDARAATAAAAEAERLKAESDRAALLAPDRDKLAFLITQIAGINIPQLETPEAEKITRNVKTLLGKVRTYIEQEADKL